MSITNIYNFICEKVFLNSTKGFYTRYILGLPYKILKGFIRFYIKVYYKYFLSINKKCTVESNVIVSLTSYPARMKTLHITLKTIINQTYRPKKIVLWLTNEEFPNQLEDVPNNIKQLSRYNVEIVFVDDNLKPHNKYFYAFKNFPDDTIITFDDDMLYLTNTIEHLIKLKEKYPNYICANMAREIVIKDNDFVVYKKWNTVKTLDFVSSNKYMALGYAGVLYPPSCMKEIIFDKNLIKETCLHADDLWLKACALLSTVKVAYGGKFFPKPFPISGTQETGLKHYNEGEICANDKQWKNICDNLNITPSMFNN